MRKDFLDEELFGNEAGEDENKDRLASYYLEKPENSVFFSSRKPLSFVRARKGVGKSALLSYASYKLEKENPKAIYISVKASDLISIKPHPSLGASSLQFTNYWQECLCTRIAIEIGRNIKIAASDDSMMLVEMAELLGYKGRNIVTALCERYKHILPQLAAEKKCAENSEELLKRYAQKDNISVWFFIDDIDATFIDTPENRILVSSFFSACRNIVNAVKGLFIRASVRTDIWAIIKDDEALDKCEQYILENVANPISIENIAADNPLDIAHFLYRIGFITLDDKSFDNGDSFIRFEDVPDLLIPSNYNPKDIWAIHPSYRSILHLN